MLKLRRAPSSYDETFMDTMASEYLERTPWTQLRLDAVQDLVDPRPDDRILDLGCAAGAITHYLSTFGCDVTGVDLEPLAIMKARGLFPGLHFEIANATDLPFGDENFDKAVAADFVEHVDAQTFLDVCAEVRRVLVPEGTFALYAPNPRHLIERLKERELLLAQRTRRTSGSATPTRPPRSSTRAASGCCGTSGGRASSAVCARSSASPGRGSSYSATASASWRSGAHEALTPCWVASVRNASALVRSEV